MPHGSGGGSHGGGSHSSHSSHGGHGGSHGSGNRMSYRPYPGARRYRYMRRNGSYRYVYANSAPKPHSLLNTIITLLFMIPFLCAGVVITVSGFGMFSGTKKLQGVKGNGVYIEDNIDVISNPEELTNTLMDFEEKTGIVPYVITTSNDKWRSSYNGLENYAYDLYVNHFADEDHFLVVYSAPKNEDTTSFVDWYWEGMQGDNTDGIINQEHFTTFQNDLQRYLTMDSYSVGEAFNITFKNSLNYMMEKSSGNGYWSVILFAIVWDGIILMTILSTIMGFVRSRKVFEEAPINQNSNVQHMDFDNNQPNSFMGNQNNMSNQPNPFMGNQNNMSNQPNSFMGNQNNMSNQPNPFSGNQNNMSNQSNPFSGNQNSMSNQQSYYSNQNSPSEPTLLNESDNGYYLNGEYHKKD